MEPEYHFNDGVFADAGGRSDRAIASYQRAVELRPSYPPRGSILDVSIIAWKIRVEQLSVTRKQLSTMPST